jgi:hypothetical protein
MTFVTAGHLMTAGFYQHELSDGTLSWGFEREDPLIVYSTDTEKKRR